MQACSAWVPFPKMHAGLSKMLHPEGSCSCWSGCAPCVVQHLWWGIECHAEQWQVCSNSYNDCTTRAAMWQMQWPKSCTSWEQIQWQAMQQRCTWQQHFPDYFSYFLNWLRLYCLMLAWMRGGGGIFFRTRCSSCRVLMVPMLIFMLHI